MKPIKIGSFIFNDPVFLAPMAGVTDTAYRVIAHDMGCPLAFAEMVRVLSREWPNSMGDHNLYRPMRILSSFATTP